MITGILSILGSSAFGSLLGGLFAWLNRKSDIEAKRIDLAHEAAKWAHDLLVKDKDLEYAKVEAAGRKDVAIIEGEASMQTARFNAIAAAQEADRITADELKAAGKWKWLLVWAATFNKLIRPLATVLLTGAAIYINFLFVGKLIDVWPNLDKTQQYDAAMQAFAWITGQAGACLGYWFVSRGSSK
ncbi:hypothetical protein UFOVP1254_90 [uncultured Caudovirales phage]|uniref:Holin of 3TMs, for gene-transfer release n=1 Tax=uncultured Caudovirales phage TaxID=2100421 RepID=A0A6J5RBX0_9CAUD|nr:hypothetical protein UFOVP1254_90 [uncultured Caudovirales phage]